MGLLATFVAEWSVAHVRNNIRFCPVKLYTPQPQTILPFQPGTQRYGAEIGQDAMAWPTANIKTTAASAFFMVIPFTCGYFSTAKIQAIW